MVKPILYYIVLAGTNDRALTIDDAPLMVRKESVDSILKKCATLAEEHGYHGYEFESILIEEFERTFTEPEEW